MDECQSRCGFSTHHRRIQDTRRGKRHERSNILCRLHHREFPCVLLSDSAMFGGFLFAPGLFTPAQNGSKNQGTLIWQQIKDYPTTSACVKFIALKDKHSLGSAAIIYDSGTCLNLSLEQSFGLCASKESTPTLLQTYHQHLFTLKGKQPS